MIFAEILFLDSQTFVLEISFNDRQMFELCQKYHASLTDMSR